MKNKSIHADVAGSYQRRDFMKVIGSCTVAAGGLVLGVPAFGEQQQQPKVETNIDDFTRVPRTPQSVPGPFPGKLIRVTDQRSLNHGKIDGKVVAEMFEKGVTQLTGRSMKDSFSLFFNKNDVIGLKVNPIGYPLINTQPELVEAVVAWLTGNGVARENLYIWDRFDYMLAGAGFDAERFPGIHIEGLQVMDPNGKNWRDKDGNHLSVNNFDKNVFYYAKGVTAKSDPGYKDDGSYLNQHVFDGEYSYFGKLVTQKVTKLISISPYKNTGNGISMATKNIAYGSICNTARLHVPLFFKVCTEVIAAPAIRDKLMLCITDGIRAQYNGGPDKNAQFIYPNHTLYFSTDPFCMDWICQKEMTAKRKAMGVPVNQNPLFTEYLHYAEQLGLGVTDEAKIKVVQA
jgi:hypothetical protein